MGLKFGAGREASDPFWVVPIAEQHHAPTGEGLACAGPDKYGRMNTTMGHPVMMLFNPRGAPLRSSPQKKPIRNLTEQATPRNVNTEASSPV